MTKTKSKTKRPTKAKARAVTATTAAPTPSSLQAEWDDAGRARLLAHLHGDRLRYVAEERQWRTWDGKRWTRDDDSGARLAAVRVARRIKVDALALPESSGEEKRHRRSALQYAARSASRFGVDACVSMARDLPKLRTAPAAFDANPWLLNVLNGTLDLRTGKLREHRPEDLLTALAPTAYDPNAQCPRFEALLHRAMGGDTGLVDYLQRFAGYCLTGDVGAQVLPYHRGEGANGKSTWLGAMMHVLGGDYACAAVPGLLFERRNERHLTELASLNGKRLVVCAEVQDGQAVDEARVKDLIGGGIIKVRRMREDPWDMHPTFKLVAQGNHDLVIRGTDLGIWRRVRIVPWLVTVAEHEKDTDLPTKLRQEAEGILAWMVAGCLAWQREGLNEPAAVKDATQAFRRESDDLGTFVERHLVLDATATVARRILREAYESHCEDSGSRPVSPKMLAARLRTKGATPTTLRMGVQVLDAWRGVRLATAAEAAAASTWRAEVTANG